MKYCYKLRFIAGKKSIDNLRVHYWERRKKNYYSSVLYQARRVADGWELGTRASESVSQICNPRLGYLAFLDTDTVTHDPSPLGTSKR